MVWKRCLGGTPRQMIRQRRQLAAKSLCIFFFCYIEPSNGWVGKPRHLLTQASSTPLPPPIYSSTILSSTSLDSNTRETSPKTDPLVFPVFPSDKRRQASSTLIDAAATVTQESCPLLGIKSLGVDYGLVRTGVAVTVGYEPKPIAILTNNLNNNSTTAGLSRQIIRHAQSQRASRIIVGLPLHKNGTVAEQTNLTLDFCQELAQHVLRELGPTVVVHLWDERYTSKEAAARAHVQDPDRFLYGTLDADAACIILENYYHDNGLGALTVKIPEAVRRDCIATYEDRQRKEQRSLQAAVDEREMKIQRRKEAIARCVKLEEQQRAMNGLKSKKKKRKRNR